MIYESSNAYRKATANEKLQVLSMDINRLLELFKDAPTVMYSDTLYAIVDDVAYPLRELAENTKSDTWSP